MAGPWRTPRTWLTGENVTDVMLNQHIRDQLSALKNDHLICCARLTLASGVPVTTVDVTGAATVYVTPHRGNVIAVHDGDNWQALAFSELSFSIGTDLANTNYDVFAYQASGAIAVERMAWTNATTRAVSLTTIDGVYVKASDTTRRYLGTYRTTAVGGQTEDSLTKRFLWNYYHRVCRPVRVTESADSWTYTTSTYRQSNNSSANQVAAVFGVAGESVVALSLVAHVSNSVGGVNVSAGIGMDSTAIPSPGVGLGLVVPATSVFQIHARHVFLPAAGYHYFAALEYSVASGVTTWYGDNGNAALMQSGIEGVIE